MNKTNIYKIYIEQKPPREKIIWKKNADYDAHDTSMLVLYLTKTIIIYVVAQSI